MRKQARQAQTAETAHQPDAMDDWSDDFESAPKDKPIIVTPDGERRVEAAWRKTRRYDNELRGWTDSGYWADPIMKHKLPFEPLGWMPAAEQPKAPGSVA